MRRLFTNRRTATVVIAVLAAALLAGPAYALQPKHTMRVEIGQSFEEDFSGIPLMAPTLFSPSLEGCDTADYCDLIRFDLIEDGPDFGNSFQLDLSWDDRGNTNDLDMYLWDEAGDEVTHSATGSPGESMGVVDFPGGTYYLGVLNWAGVNTGYTVAGSFTKEEITIFRGDTEDSEPAPQSAPATAPEPEPDTEPTSAPVAPAVDRGPSPEQIERPGDTGPDAAFALGAVPASLQGERVERGTSVAVIVFGILTGVALVAGATFVGVKIHRDVQSF